MINEFLIGCCYYPEHWDESELDYDLERIKGLGFNCIRIGEFSWSMYEKEEGKYDFSFITEVVRRAEALGLYVIVGTPTAAPPRWLTKKHPEVLCVSSDRTVMQHGSRQHHNHTSEIYLEYCARITEAMVKSLCGFKNVIGWQIDNELNCHRKESYAEADDAAFRVWLREKYGTVEALNEAWGNRFWSLEFNDFSQIHCPRPNPAYNNPTWVTDYYLFLSDTVINYAAVQTRIIRKYAPNAFITHNGGFDNIDFKKFTRECTDILSFDSYPSFQEKLGKGLGRNVDFRLAGIRGYSEKFLILEQQAGPGGQLRYLLPTPRPGQIRLWTYQSIAHGAIGVLYFRYRTALYGAEQLWYGIYDHDREENYRSREVRAVAEELSRVGDIFTKEKLSCEIAIFRNYHNVSVDKVECFAGDDCWNIFMELNKNDLHADFVDENSDFGKYKVLIVPHVTIADEALAEKIKQFTDNGGIAIISARSGTKDKNGHFYPEKAPGVFRKLAGCRVDWFTAAANGERQYAVMNGKKYAAETYFEMLEPEGAEVIGEYTEGFLGGRAGIVRCGNVYYVGFYSRESADLYTDIISRHITFAAPIDPDVEEYSIGKYKLYLNHSDRSIAFSGYDKITERELSELSPYGVALKEI